MAHDQDNDDPVMGAAAGFLEATRRFHLTPAKWGVLACIAERPGLSVKDIAGRLGVFGSNVSRRVDELVKAGLVARKDDPANRRQVRLTLTEAGNGVMRGKACRVIPN